MLGHEGIRLARSINISGKTWALFATSTATSAIALTLWLATMWLLASAFGGASPSIFLVGSVVTMLSSMGASTFAEHLWNRIRRRIEVGVSQALGESNANNRARTILAVNAENFMRAFEGLVMALLFASTVSLLAPRLALSFLASLVVVVSWLVRSRGVAQTAHENTLKQPEKAPRSDRVVSMHNRFLAQRFAELHYFILLFAAGLPVLNDWRSALPTDDVLYFAPVLLVALLGLRQYNRRVVGLTLYLSSSWFLHQKRDLLDDSGLD